MSMKKIICAIMALALVFALAGCREGALDDKLDEVLDGDSGGDTVDTDDTDDTGDTDAGDAEIETIDYMLFSNGLDDNGHFEGVTALDYVTLPDFSTLTRPSADKLTDRAIEDGDIVNIDYVGSIDGVEFDGGSTQGAGTEVVIGVTSYIDDFIAQLIGHMPGENFDIEVTFPENYQATDLAGKDAVFNITVNFIWDVTDQLAQDLGFENRDSMAQYIGLGYSTMDAELEAGPANYFMSKVEIIEIPASVQESINEKLELQVRDQASQYGLDVDTLLMYSGYESLEDYVSSMGENQARWSLAVQAVAEQEGIEVTVEDISQSGAESAIDIYGRPFISFGLLSDKVSVFLNESIV